MSAIEWTDETWNPVTGCDRVSPGCAHCYALDLAARLKGMGQAKYQRDGDPKTSGPGFGLTLHPDVLEQPLRWRRPRRVFVNSMSDLFHEDIPDEYIARVFSAMGGTHASRHTFQVLTKRPERMKAWFEQVAKCEHGWLTHNGSNPSSYGGTGEILPDHLGWPMPNVWLGVSIENRRFVHRADVLRETPAAVRFISAEPLLGPLIYDSDIGMATDRDWPGADDDEYAGVPEHLRGDPYTPAWSDGADLPELDLASIDWLIVGGESGPDARPMAAEWVRDLRDTCQSEKAAFFFKQWGGRTPKAGGRELDGHTWDEFPEPAHEAVPA